MATQCALRTLISRTPQRGVMWDGPCANGSNLHSTRWVCDAPQPADVKGVCGTIDYDDQPSDAACERCSTPVPWGSDDLRHFGGAKLTYDSPTGDLGPGDMHWVEHPYIEDHGGHCSGGWSNCDGRHLIAICPNGAHWDIDSRANNCTMKDDTTHRCWIRTGEPPMVTAGKAGHTCTAGAGSIQAGNYHGFLQNGAFT